MKTLVVPLARLQDIARRGGLQYAVDATRRTAYLRVGQTRYVAALEAT